MIINIVIVTTDKSYLANEKPFDLVMNELDLLSEIH